MGRGRAYALAAGARAVDVFDGVAAPRPLTVRALGDREIPDNVSLGRGARIDADARLGVRARGVQRSTKLKIGSGAGVRRGAVIYAGNVIGDGLDAGHNVMIHENSVIGNWVEIGDNTVIAASCRIGDRVRIGPNAYIAQLTKLEGDVSLGPGATLADDPHPGSDTRLCAHGPVVRRGAQIGMNATVLSAVVIGSRSVVGAGSVVTKDVEPAVVVVGNPARPL